MENDWREKVDQIAADIEGMSFDQKVDILVSIGATREEAREAVKDFDRNTDIGIGIGTIVKVKTACDADNHLIGQIGKVREICNGHFGHVVQVSVEFPGYQGIHKFYPDALTIEYHTR